MSAQRSSLGALSFCWFCHVAAHMYIWNLWHPPSLIRAFVVRMKKTWALRYPRAHSEDAYKTGRMPKLIWVFAGRTLNFVVFVMSRLTCTFGIFLHSDVPCFMSQFQHCNKNSLKTKFKARESNISKTTYCFKTMQQKSKRIFKEIRLKKGPFYALRLKATYK